VPRFPLLTLLLTLSPASAAAATVELDEAAYADRLAAVGASNAARAGFEALAIGTPLVGAGVEPGLSVGGPALVLPDAFGAPPHGARVAATVLLPGVPPRLELRFAEAQRALSAFWLDAAGPLRLSAYRGDVWIEDVDVPVAGEDVAGGRFAGFVFASAADLLVVVAGAPEDGFGVDEIAFAAFGTVDDDGDGWAEADGDCDDADPSRFPGPDDPCDGIDADCDGVAELSDLDGDGFAPCDGDCADGDPARHPGAAEDCDGEDDDCDGLIDEQADADGDGATPCEGDCDDADPARGLAAGCDGESPDPAATGSPVGAIRGIAGGGCGGPALGICVLIPARAFRRRRPACLLWLAGVAGLLPSAPGAVWAIDTSRFERPLAEDAGLLVEGVTVAPGSAFGGGVALSSERRPIVFTEEGAVGGAVIESRTMLQLRGVFRVAGRLRAVADLPMALGQSGVDPRDGAALPVIALSDLRLGLLASLPTAGPLRFALAGRLTLPTGQSRALLSARTPSFALRAAGAVPFAWGSVRCDAGGEAGWRIRAEEALLDHRIGPEAVGGVRLGCAVLPRLAVWGEFSFVGGPGKRAGWAEWAHGAAIGLDRAESFALRVGMSTGVGRGVGTPELRLVAAFDVTPRKRPLAPVVSPDEPAVPPPAASSASARRPARFGLVRVDGAPGAAVELRFAFDETRPLDTTALRAFAEWWSRTGAAGAIAVRGHADERGSVAYNDALGRRRAEAVAAALFALGVPLDLVRIASSGEREPARFGEAAATPELRWAADRRAVVTWHPGVRNGP
jgi:outer membrane protein OmpA-like peptidoglycan-associated protein